MKEKRQSYGRYVIALLLAAVLFVSMQLFAHATSEEGTGQVATVKAGKTDINVRATAVDGGVVATVDGGDSFDVLGQTTGSDGKVWYEISGKKGDKNIRGYIRSDMVDISEKETAPEEPEEGKEGDGDTAAPAEESGGDETPVTTTMGSILAMDPPAGEDGSAAEPPYLPKGFSDTRIRVGEREVQAWTNETFYIFYATSPSGNVGWFLYDSAEGRWVRYIDFLIDGSGSGSVSSNGGKGGANKGLVIILIVVIILLAGGCAFLAFKLFSGGRDDDYYDDDDDDDYRPARRQQAPKQPAARSVQPAGMQQRSSQQIRPQGPATSGPRPQAQRPAGQRPAGGPAPQQRPAGTRPAGGPQAPMQRQSQPAAPVHRQSQPGAPVTRRSSQGAPVQRQQPVRQSRPQNPDDEE
ncbi:MAG: hypothetical protein IK115_12835 [Lachnospiraceae bacterium]|nr:hypothetical protein [Lachnospiraceae bacterium]